VNPGASPPVSDHAEGGPDFYSFLKEGNVKPKRLGIILIFFLALLVVALCTTQEEEPAAPPEPQPAVQEVTLSRGIQEMIRLKELDPEKMKTLREGLLAEIQEFYSRLDKNFQEKNFEALAAAFQEKGTVLVEPLGYYERIAAPPQVVNLFAQSWGEGRKLNFETLYIFIDRVEPALKVWVEETGQYEEVDFVACVRFRYHIVKPDKSNSAGDGSIEFLHRRICRWDG